MTKESCGDKTTSEACQTWADYFDIIYAHDKYQISKENIKLLRNTFKTLAAYFKEKEEESKEEENDKGITW